MGEKANPLWRRAVALHFFTFHSSLAPAGSAPLGLPFSDFPGGNQRPRRGRSAGVTFVRAKVTKTRLGRSPLRTSLGVRGWTCVKPKFGPLPLLWRLAVPPHQATLGSWPYGWVVSTSGPTLEERRSRRRKPGYRSLGTAANQGKALGVEGLCFREAGIFGRITDPSM